MQKIYIYILFLSYSVGNLKALRAAVSPYPEIRRQIDTLIALPESKLRTLVSETEVAATQAQKRSQEARMKDTDARKKWASMRMYRDRDRKMKGVGQGRKRKEGDGGGSTKSEWNDSVDDILSFMDSFDDGGKLFAIY